MRFDEKIIQLMMPASRDSSHLYLPESISIHDGHRREGIVEERIAECAKRIWALLEQTPEVNILHLAEVLGGKGIIAYQALGWLARDQKIRYEQRGSQFFISCHIGGTSTPPDQRQTRRES